MTKVGGYAIDTSTTLESNKSQRLLSLLKFCKVSRRAGVFGQRLLGVKFSRLEKLIA